jgi:hypothetical protein
MSETHGEGDGGANDDDLVVVGPYCFQRISDEGSLADYHRAFAPKRENALNCKLMEGVPTRR